VKIAELVEQFFAAGRKAAQSDDPEELHNFRIAAKRLRYSIEILDPKGGEEWLKRLKVVQGQLGDVQDAVVAEAFLRGLPKRSAAARPLPRRLHILAGRHMQAFRSTWARRFGARTEAAWLKWAQSVEN